MKMVTINETDSDSYYWDENEETIEGVDQLKRDWNDLPLEKRTGLFTLEKVPFEIDARSVLEELYEKLAESEQGYEDTYDCLENDTTDEYEKQHVMINVNKIIIVYRNNAGTQTQIKVDGLEYPLGVRETYEEIKYKLKGVVNVR